MFDPGFRPAATYCLGGVMDDVQGWWREQSESVQEARDAWRAAGEGVQQERGTAPVRLPASGTTRQPTILGMTPATIAVGVGVIAAGGIALWLATR
jgi:hypothetical protein